MSLAKIAVLELGVQLISTAVMIVLAWLYRSIWALIIGNVLSGLIQMIWSHFLVPEQRNRLAWDQDAAQSIFSFGKWIFVATALTFLALQSDRIILGKLISFEMLGVYGIAFTLADIPRSIILALTGKVIFPAFSQLIDLPRTTFRDKILKNRQPILIALAIGLTILISFGDRLIFFLYKPEYHQAGWMLPIIALGIWHTTLYSTMSPALLALGKSQYSAQGYLFAFLTISIGLPLAFQQWGMLGAILVVAFYDLPLYAVNMYGLWREGMICIGQDFKTTGLFLGLLSIVLLGRVICGWGLPIAQILQ
jgi:O-antigen/teichoic acid export membrane protein